MKNFNSFTKELVKTKSELNSLETILDELCDFLSSVVNEGDLAQYNPFTKGYNEEVESWSVGEDSISVLLTHYDSYGDYNTHTRVDIPAKIIDLFLNDDRRASEYLITKEVLKLCEINNKMVGDLDLVRLKNSAKELGYSLVREVL